MIKKFLIKIKQLIIELNKENYLVHMLFGIVICGSVTCLLSFIGFVWSYLIGLLMVIVLEGFNELYVDGSPDWKDVLWTYAGPLAVLLFMLLSSWIGGVQWLS